MVKTYSELITIDNFLDRYKYLKIGGNVGAETFGYNRYLNQILYTSKEWKQFRLKVISRDCACDLGFPNHDIFNKKGIIIHHINPITLKQIYQRDPMIFLMDNVICTSLRTHNAIHYGSDDLIADSLDLSRKRNDTCPWKNDE